MRLPPPMVSFRGGGASFDDETAMGEIGPLHHPDLLLPERMTCLDQKGKVVCTAKDGGTKKVFPSLEGPAAMCFPIRDLENTPGKRKAHDRRGHGLYDSFACLSSRPDVEWRLFDSAFRQNSAAFSFLAPYLISPMALTMLAEPLTTCFLPLSRITTVGVERILSSVRYPVRMLKLGVGS